MHVVSLVVACIISDVFYFYRFIELERTAASLDGDANRLIGHRRL